MGNKLCAPLLKKTYRHEDYPFHVRKDSHLLRLWAEIFRVHGDGDYMRWERVSDDVVPVNITCVEDTPHTIFQITAYNRHVEKIFDVKLIQPGTIICPATECFVHWRDSVRQCEWGLNFTCPTDARRFRECCCRVRSKVSSISSPSSPVGQHRHDISPTDGPMGRCVSSDLSHLEFDPQGSPSKSSTSTCRAGDQSATMPRGRPGEGGDLGGGFFQPNLTKPPSNTSVYDNVNSPGYRKPGPPENRVSGAFRRSLVSPSPGHPGAVQPNGAVHVDAKTDSHRSPQHHPNPHPHQHSVHWSPQHQVFPDVPLSQTRSLPHQSSKQAAASYQRTSQTPPGLHRSPQHTPPHQPHPYPSKPHPGQPHPSQPHHPQPHPHPSQPQPHQPQPHPPQPQPHAPPGNVPRIHWSPQHQQSQPSSASSTPTKSSILTSAKGSIVRFSGTGSGGEVVHMETAFLAENPQQKSPHLQVDTTACSGQLEVKSTHTSSSESPDWPPPPEPLTPQTPLDPVCHMDFDSDALKKMLRSIPQPMTDSLKDDSDQGFHDGNNVKLTAADRQRQFAMSGIHSQPEGVKAKSYNGGQGNRQSPQGRYPGALPSADSADSLNISRQTRTLENEFHLRNQCARDSYPDSGIGGMNYETVGSVSADSSKSSLARQDTGVDPIGSQKGSFASSSDGGSSLSGQSGDIINMTGDGGEIRQFLNTELSDEEEADSDGSIHTMTESHMSYSRQTGAIRKAGWLVVKNWLVHKKRKVELAPKRSWKKYWVCLKGTTLLFFEGDEETVVDENTEARHFLIVEGGLAQAVPEHPKRENIFSLSTSFGDAYLFQAQTQTELNGWINAIHSACASSFARQHGKDNTIKLLRNEVSRLETNIDMDLKMKKMADLQLSVVTDAKSRQAIVKQIAQWEENLEKMYIEQYRLRCYMASLHGSELPNPKVLLGSVAKTTKAILGRLGIFTVSSFHVLVCARVPTVPPSTGMQTGRRVVKPIAQRPDTAVRASARTPVKTATTPDGRAERRGESPGSGLPALEHEEGTGVAECLSRVALPNSQTVVVCVDDQMCVQELLEAVCNKRQLDPRDHFVRFRVAGSSNSYSVPDKSDYISKQNFDSIEVCQKSMFQVELVKRGGHTAFGFSIEAELAEDSERDDELQVYVSDVQRGGLADLKGLLVGDEILVINGKVVSELDMVYVETLLQEAQVVCLTVRSCRTQRPYSTFMMEHADLYIDNMVCRPPPSQSRLSQKILGELTVPAPLNGRDEPNQRPHSSPKKVPAPALSPSQIDALLKGAEQVTAMCKSPQKSQSPGSQQHNLSETTVTAQYAKPLSEAQKLRKVIMELIDTERGYVKDLICLTERYLEPLKEETFLTTDEIEQLFGNIQEIVQFQKQFLHSLEEAIGLDDKCSSTEDSRVFRRILFSLGGSFLYYANHFKVYSSFCASHSRSQKILNPEANQSLREFLRARNPKQQHSATLESYLIKPIQRILKYPLLLQQLRNLTDPDTDEHHHLSEALKGMEAVAEHINEMQKIYEEYGSVFDEMAKQYRETHPHNKNVDLSVGELQMYGTVEWINASESLGKIKKGMEFENTVFVFRMGVVFLTREKVKRKKTKSTPGRSSVAEVYEMVDRYKLLIPVHELNVRCHSMSDTDTKHCWEMVHCKSETEGRPERVYQFCNNSLEAKADFLRIIRQTVKDSSKKVQFPPVKAPGKGKYIPLGGKKLESLQTNPRNAGKKRNGKDPQQPERHSMNLEENVHTLEYDNTFRTRSKTIGDLNNEVEEEDTLASPFMTGSDLQMVPFMTGSEPQITQTRASPSSSTSNLSGSSHGSAKLLHASANPTSFSAPVANKNADGSPIWKPRDDSPTLPSPTYENPPPMSQGPVNSRASVYGDCSEIVYRNDNATLFFNDPSVQAQSTFKDTEC
ncbi:protein still life, isoform SIF type 1-like isoform X2 [Liolophura sinensis]|uniref:protein still life, isoform SIF type 1-like isoform X2 n=1 Tax=Liolophura sinensis TaxID=3198878 RepID=UPI00315949B2